MRRPARFLLAASLGAGSVALLAGCMTVTADGSRPGERTVVATTTQVADFTREIVGDEARVVQLIQPNQSVHAFDPSAAALVEIGGADVLVINGAGLEPWVEDTVEASGFDGLIIDAGSESARALDELDASSGIEPESQDSEHSGHDHHEDGLDPHIWTDPRLARNMVETIAEGLERAFPESATMIATNASAYQSKLDMLDEWIRQNVSTVPEDRRLLVSNHDVFAYFVDAYDITFIGSIIPGLDDHAEPNAAAIDELVESIRATGAQAVFSEASISPKAAEAIADEAGVVVYAGENALYGDSLGPAGSSGETYLDAQVHNVRMLLEAWGQVATDPPAGLDGSDDRD